MMLVTEKQEPPPYFAPDMNRTNAASSAPPHLAGPPPSVHPSNYVQIKNRFYPVNGSFLIDPDLFVPAELLTLTDAESNDCGWPGGVQEGTSEGEGVRRNLRLESRFGPVDADVWVVGWDDTSRRSVGTPVLVDAKGHYNRAVNVKLFANCAVHPVRMRAASHHGTVTVYLPPSFRGPATLSTKFGNIKLSGAIQERLTTYSDVSGVRRCFIGDLPTEEHGKGEWKGSTLDARSYYKNVCVSSTEELGKGWKFPFISAVFK